MISAELKARGALKPMTLAVRQEGPAVVLFINGVGDAYRTVDAHRAGFDLIRHAANALPGDCVALRVNGGGIDLSPPHAKRLGVALLRKADAADDWQTQLGKRK